MSYQTSDGYISLQTTFTTLEQPRLASFPTSLPHPTRTLPTSSHLPRPNFTLCYSTRPSNAYYPTLLSSLIGKSTIPATCKPATPTPSLTPPRLRVYAPLPTFSQDVYVPVSLDLVSSLPVGVKRMSSETSPEPPNKRRRVTSDSKSSAPAPSSLPRRYDPLSHSNRRQGARLSRRSSVVQISHTSALIPTTSTGPVTHRQLSKEELCAILANHLASIPTAPLRRSIKQTREF